MTDISKKNFFSILFIVTFFFGNNAFANCKNEYKHEVKKSISTIELIFNNEKKWQKYLLKVVVDRPKYNYLNKLNKNFYGRVKINYTSGESCIFKSRIKLHGNDIEHISLDKGYPISSLRIKLLEGNINNITNFILFLPKTRNEDNEIFITSFLRNMGIVVPKTFYVKVKNKERYTKYIFQENLKKEFLEANNLIEGPVFEGHENIAETSKFFRLARLTNDEWIKDSQTKIFTSIMAMSDINILFLKDPNVNTKNVKKLPTEIFHQDPLFFIEEENKKFNLYDALAFALGSTHNLTRDDRKYYFDPIYGTFTPLYYDGRAKILNFDLKKLVYDYNKDHKRTTSTLIDNPSVTAPAKDGALDAIYLLNKINKEKLLDELNENGLNIDSKKLNKIIGKIEKRLNIIKSATVDKKDFTLNNSIYSRYANNPLTTKDTLIFFNNDSMVKSVKPNLIKLKICDLSLINCIIKESLSSKDVKKIFKQKYNSKYSENLFIGDNFNGYKMGDLKRSKLGIRSFKKIDVDKNFKIAINDQIKIQINREEKIITLEQISWKGRAVIYKSQVSFWKIIFNNTNDTENKTKVIPDYQNLTGCLTIIDTFIKDLEILANDLVCEDSINFIRSKGGIKNISINNSYSDALDNDFSHLDLEFININKANNDCVDLSFGKYKIHKAKLINCGDKAISVGEKSFLQADEVIVENSNFGIVSKDSSISKLKNVYLKNLKTCVSAYNKKQEFSGSLIEIQNIECKNFDLNIYSDTNSKVILKNEL